MRSKRELDHEIVRGSLVIVTFAIVLNILFWGTLIWFALWAIRHFFF